MTNPARVNALVMDDFGVNWTETGDVRDIEVLADAFMDEVRAKNRSQFRLGDLYLFVSQGEFEVDLEELLSPCDLSLATVRNYASVCGAWQKHLRVVPVSFSHYADASKLVRVDPVAALKVLADAKAGNQGREFVRDEAKRLLGLPNPRTQALTLIVAADGSVRPATALATWTYNQTFEIVLREKVA